MSIITIDIGNTRAKYAVFNGDNIIETGTFNPYSDDLENVIKKHGNISKGIISSVGGRVEECLRQSKTIEMMILSGQSRLPFTIGYKHKDKIGSDRIAAVAAAAETKPNENCLVIDIGTCITYDIITKEGVHLCGPISPGISLRFKSMNDYTHKLPLCKPSLEENKPICNSTEESLQAGVMIGISSEINNFIETYSNIYKKINVFIIGGDNIFFENKLKNCIFADGNFIFNGLRYILDYQ